DDGTGASWRSAARNIENRNIYSLASRRDGNRAVLFAGAEPASIYRSDDLGERWRALPALRGVPGTDKWHFPPPPHIAHVKSITIHPTRPATLFTCIEQGALLISEDDGETWRELDDYSKPEDPTYRDTHHIALHPKTSRDCLSGDWRRHVSQRQWRA